MNFQFKSVGEGTRNLIISQVWKLRSIVPKYMIKTSQGTQRFLITLPGDSDPWVWGRTQESMFSQAPRQRKHYGLVASVAT